LGRTGPINVLKGIVRNYDLSRYRAVIVTLSPESANSQLNEFEKLGFPIVQLELSRIAGFLKGRKRLIQVARETNARIIHCHGFRATRLAVCPEFNGRTIASVVSDIDVDYRFAYGPVRGLLMARAEYSALHRFHTVVSCSGAAGDALNRHGIDSTEIINGISLSGFRVDDYKSTVADSRALLGWDPDRIVILHTGILMERKRPLDVIEAFRQSKLAGKALLVFAGNGPLMEECMARAGGTSDIIFLGLRKDMKKLLYAADCLVSASASEGMPMALLEGCATGIRILASEIPPHRQMMNLFPANVQTFRLGNVSEITEHFDLLAKESRIERRIPSMLELDPISDTRMSLSYQALYDRIS
jgi:glycosyltransferase involved in cell wall biosynthesis